LPKSSLLFFIVLIQISFLSFSAKSQGFKIIWADEFNSEGKPSSQNWNYETGFIRNLEEQIYTKRKKNIRVNKGNLEIIALREKYRNRKYDLNIKNYRINTPYAEYTSASINTKDKFEFKYGRVEVRAKLPKGLGVWPAIWMLGANFDEIDYPKAGEIDIMEHVGKEPDKIHATVHYSGSKGIKSDGGTQTISDLSKDFHVYSVSWSPEKIEFLIDNAVFHSFNIEEAGKENNPFRKPFYLIINLALGGNWAGKPNPDIFPQKFLIDYVRVYKKLEK